MPSHPIHSYKYDSKTTAYYNARIRGNVFGIKNLLSLYEMSDLHHFHTGEMESLSAMHFLLREWENTASVSSKVASDEIKKLFPDPFLCGPRYLLQAALSELAERIFSL